MSKSPAIVSDAEVMGGTPVFSGTRVPFQTLLDYLESGHRLRNSSKTFRAPPRNCGRRLVISIGVLTWRSSCFKCADTLVRQGAHSFKIDQPFYEPAKRRQWTKTFPLPQSFACKPHKPGARLPFCIANVRVTNAVLSSVSLPARTVRETLRKARHVRCPPQTM